MKRLISVLLAVVCFVLMCGCGEESADSNSQSDKQRNVLHAQTGDVFSEDRLRSVIEEYQKDCVPFEVKRGETVTFDVGFDAAWCSVSRLSPVDDSDIDKELKGYIDLYVNTQCNGEGKVTVDAGWWYNAGESTRKNDTWSYFIRAMSEDEKQYEYFYFRVHFNE